MTREIKFRAWDKKDRKWLDEFLITPDGEVLIVGEYEKPKSGLTKGWVSGENVELVRYTGLKDKNGLEIYEGDRIKHNQYPTPLVVQWDWDQWGLFDGICNEASIGKDDVEVVGNIYENKG